jgi:glycosyltransferase involved in cell wall biosynthesis
VRILYLCADRGISLQKYNGATAHFRSLVRAFTKTGNDVLVLTPSDADAAVLGADVASIPTPALLRDLLERVEQTVPRAEREGQRARKRVVHALGHVWNNVATEQALEREIARFRPDFVFELHSPYGAAGVLTCNRLGVRHVLNVHAPLAWEGATFRAQALQEAAELLEDEALGAARCIIANSAEMGNQLAAAGVAPECVEVVVNGVDLDLFAPAGPVRRVGPPDSVVVAFSGSLKGWHGVDVLCDAFRLLASDPRLHLLVIGDGPLRKEVARLADELPGRVTQTGAIPLEEVPEWLRGADIAVAPYPQLDPFYFSPLKILDAMACGIANVASAIGQIPELLRDGETGVLVTPGDADALAAALRDLAADPARRAGIAAAGLRAAQSSHSWTARATDIVAIAMGRGALVNA